jgi:thiamine biosynthesis lipoprotein
MLQKTFVMGMPCSIQIVDAAASQTDVEEVFTYLRAMEAQFSTYKADSEIQRINRGELSLDQCSSQMRTVLSLCEQTRGETNGFFDIHLDGRLDPAGIVKGFAIYVAAEMLRQKGFANFFLEIGGDIQTCGKNENNEKWIIGIRNPFNISEIVQMVHLSDRGIATSGTYLRGYHIHDPVHRKPADELVSLTVIGPNVYEADRFATAAFAMGTEGLGFLESLGAFESCMITKDNKSYATAGFAEYMVP